MAESSYEKNPLAYLAAIVESSDDIIVSKTLEGVITSWNHAAERILGYRADEAIGQHINLIIPEDLWPEEEDLLARIRNGLKVDHFETTRRRKDGTLLTLSITVSPIRDDNGRIIGASKVARDITDRKRIEEELGRAYAAEKLARERAESASRVKDEFLAVVSHELRSPLNAISGWAAVLQKGEIDKDQTTKAVNTILRNVKAQDNLINDLLDMSRIVSGRMRLSVRAIELLAPIEAAVEVIKPAAQAKGVSLQTVLDQSAGPVAGDPDRLQQVFSNLLSNAVKFTSRGGRVQVRLERVNSHVEMSVSDTGQGIEPKELSSIFELFHQGENSTTRRHGGLGLGLGIAKSLVELHGGSIVAHSEGLGKGAQFVVSLPIMIATQRSDELRVHPVVDDAQTDIPSLSGIRILLVDDEEDALETVSLVLSQAGAEVRTADSATKAMELFVQSIPDVFVSDIGMSGEDGYSLIRRIRSLTPDQGSNVPAIALTAFARAQDRLQAMAAGYQAHVPKPVDMGELASLAKILVKRRFA